MFDLRAIKDNPEAFRTAWERKKSGLGSNVDVILEAAEKVRVATTAKESVQEQATVGDDYIAKWEELAAVGTTKRARWKSNLQKYMKKELEKHYQEIEEARAAPRDEEGKVMRYYKTAEESTTTVGRAIAARIRRAGPWASHGLRRRRPWPRR